MRWIFYFSLLIRTFAANNRVCSKCKFYVPAIYNEKYDIGSYLGRCSKFTEVDKSSQSVVYRFAAKARCNEFECGSEGKYFANDTSGGENTIGLV
uniref:Uncharacterized protein n=1 Tax=viral metagenome TaxID=1070528 RepID=A0A6C0LQA9_9ZZZZ